ncbi:hypothetical protein PMIN02_011249 [Paraphaeosphaeria minitans]
MADESTTAPTSENISHSSRHGRGSTPRADESTVAPTHENICRARGESRGAECKEGNGTGPYGSVSTCAPSDLDAIGQGVLPALHDGKEGEEKGEGRDADMDGAKKKGE